jgi:hypothetical protein
MAHDQDRGRQPVLLEATGEGLGETGMRTLCPVTMDFNPRRLNFFYDAQTVVIKEVRCG